MNADNVNFTGANPTVGEVTADGQLLIGATAAPNIRVGSLTSLDGSIDISAGPGTLDISSAAHDLHVARFIVASSTNGTGANFTTVQAAINAAAGTGIPATVFVQPGTYTENLTMASEVDLCAFDCDGLRGNVTITGTHTVAGTIGVAVSGIRFRIDNGGNMFSVNTGCQIMFKDCSFIITANSTGFSDTTNVTTGLIDLQNCTGDVSSANSILFAKTGSGKFRILNCRITNGVLNATTATAASTASDGEVLIVGSYMPLKITTSGTAAMFVDTSEFSFDGQSTPANIGFLTFGGTGTNYVTSSYLDGGTATPITVNDPTTVSNTVVKSSNAAAVAGTSSLSFVNINFTGSSSAITTTTQVPLVSSNDAKTVVTPGAYPYTTIPQDYLIKVDTSSARTITPLASPTTGQIHVIKDTVGSAGANNITVTPSGKNIDGAASRVISTNYGSITIMYTGSEWSII